MAKAAVLKVDIVGDARDANRAIDSTSSKLDGLGSGAKKAGKLLAVGLAVGVGAAVAVGASLIGAGERASSANARIEQVAASMNLFAGNTGKVTDRLTKYAEQTARQTGLDTNAIKLTQAKLLTFRAVGESADEAGGAFDRATQAAIDLAAAGFGSAETNATQLGKALQDPIKGLAALGESGVTFTEAEKARIATLVESNRVGEAQALVLTAIEAQVKGTAAATADSSAQMAVGFEQVKERLGLALLPMFATFTAFVLDTVLPAGERLFGFLGEKLGPGFTALGGFISGTVLPAFGGLSSTLDGPTGASLRTLAGELADRVVPTARLLVGYVVGSVIPAFRAVAGFIASTVVPVLLKLAGFIVGSVIPAYLKIAGPVLGGFRSAIGSITEAVDRNRDTLAKLGRVLDTVGAALGPVASILGGTLKVAFTVAGIAIGVVIDNISRLISVAEKASRVLGKVGDAAGAIKGGLGKLNPFSSPIAGMRPALHGGGVTLDRPGGPLATAGLDDAAGFLTLAALSASSPAVVDARTFPTTVNVTGALDGPAVARQLTGVLEDHARRLGRVTLAGVG